MEKKLIALVLIALIGGLGGGYGLSYIIYQPQIQNLQNDMNILNDRFDAVDSTIANLNSTVETMENRTWHEVYSIGASSDITTGTFQLKGNLVRVMWTARGYDSWAWVSFYLYFSNGTAYGVWSSSGVKTSNNAVLELEEIGDYYLEITTYLTDYYYVSVWDYY